MKLYLSLIITAVAFTIFGYWLHGFLLYEMVGDFATKTIARDTLSKGKILKTVDGKNIYFWPSQAVLPLGFRTNLPNKEKMIPLHANGDFKQIIFYGKPVYDTKKYVVVYDDGTIGVVKNIPPFLEKGIKSIEP